MAYFSLLYSVVVFLTWSRAGHTASYPNLGCCCSTQRHTYEGNIADNTTYLTCFKASSFHSIPKSLPPSLREFNARHQNFSNFMPGDFPRLQSLRILTIRRSQVVTIQRGSFQTLPNLSQLSITENKIARLEAQTFKGLDQLEVLNLDNNRLYFIDDAAFAGLTGLRKLSLSGNCLSGIPRGTDQSTWPLQLTMTQNPLTSLIAVEELKHVLRLVLGQNGLPCDCRLREMKIWMTVNKQLQWSIACGPVPYRRVRWLSMDDLKCDYRVSVSSDYGTVTSNISLTCQTDCHEGQDLTFSWIAPNGDRLSSTHEYSKSYTDMEEAYCKGSVVTRRETRKTCYSVLRIPTLRRGMEGRYTCLVRAKFKHANDAYAVLTVAGTEFPNERPQNAGNDTNTGTYVYASQPQTTARDTATASKGAETETTTTRPGPGMSTIQLVLVGVSPFVGCSLIVMVIVACASKCRGGRQQHNANGDRNTARNHNEIYDDLDRGVSYENDDQLPDTDSKTCEVCYENDDQISDTDRANRGEYEIDDQLSDTDSANGSQYENDDQFSDGDDDGGSKQPKSLSKRVTSRRPKAKSNVLHVVAEVHAQAQGTGHYDNDKNAAGLSNSKTVAPSRHKAKSNVLHVLAEVHAQAQALDNRDDDKNAAGPSSREAAISSNKLASDGGHYDNERPVTDSVTTEPETTKRSDDGSDSDQDYMTLPAATSPGGNSGVGEDTCIQPEGKPDDRNTASTSDCAGDVPDNDYVTFPVEENVDGETRKTGGCVSDLDSASSNEEGSSDHACVTFPGEQIDEEQQREEGKKGKHLSDSDQIYVNLPGEKNDEELREAEHQNERASDLDSALLCTEDHIYVTFPSEKNTNERQDAKMDSVAKNDKEQKKSNKI
ncbi:corticospinal neuron axon guidance through spinal cord [Branchiostoma belcheri]|nr:corticospinal neuron axon guidance through spinal cord [Branchiostoma belcheri]